MSKKFIFLCVLGVVLVGGVLLLQVTNIGTEWLWSVSDGGKFLLPLIAVAALLDSINPCAFSILLLTIAFLMSLGKERRSILKIGGAYVVGLVMVYLLIGLGLLQALHLFNTPHFMAKVGAVALFLFGIVNLMNEFIPSFKLRLGIPQGIHRRIGVLLEKGTLPAAFVLGALVGLCEFPCTGGPYLMVLGLLHDQETYIKGFGYLILYNLIFILPLVIALFIASEGSLLRKVEEWKKMNMRALRIWAGVGMLILAALMVMI